MFKAYFKALKSILFPPICFSCEEKTQGNWLCGNCLQKIQFLHPPHKNLIAVTAYKEPITKLIHLFKYKHYDYLVQFFSSLMIKHLVNLGFNFDAYDFITCVPMHPLKLKKRSYNQAALLAKTLANYFKIPFKNDIIYQRSYRPSQTKLPRTQRKNNIKNSFWVDRDCANKKIILVDDIFTSGATVNACSKVLKEKGAAAITVIALSKAQ